MTITGKKAKETPATASQAIQELWSDVSGNTVNGLGDTEQRPPRPVFWRTDGSIAHENVPYYFYGYDEGNERIAVDPRRKAEGVKI